MTPETQATIRDVARCGCHVVRVQEIDTEYGRRPAIAVRCPDARSLLMLLTTRARAAAGDPHLFDFARRARQAYPGDASFAAGIHAFVQETVKFRREPVEIFQAGRYTLSRGQGDCDCQTVLAAGLAKAGGLPVRLVPFHVRPEDPRHVCAQFHHDGRWHWAETTIPAQYGEHPFAAMRRLRIRDRSDIAGRASHH